MRILAGIFFAFVFVAGCGGPAKPDPRQRPDFIDTTDPSKVQMPAPSTNSGGPAAPQP